MIRQDADDAFKNYTAGNQEHERSCAGMFTRIGKKIKTVATVLFYVLAVAFVIGAFYVIINFGQLLGIGNAILIGILIALVGCLVAWLSSLMLYGFGELVDNSTIIKDALAGGVTAEQTDHKSSPFHGLAKAVNGVRTPRQPQQPQPVQQPQGQGAYQPPQTTRAYATQPNSYGRAGSYPPSQPQPASLTGNSGWTQVDAQNIQCPNCRYTLSAAQAKVYGCCPQCRMPFNP